MVITWLAYKLTRFKSRELKFRGRRLRVDIADTLPKQLVGLMYRDSIGREEGMLFVFGRKSRWGIWMPNMNFGIDILWVSGSGKIVDIKKGVKPARSSFASEVYKPRKAAKYVLEIASGASDAYGMKIGDVIALG